MSLKNYGGDDGQGGSKNLNYEGEAAPPQARAEKLVFKQGGYEMARDGTNRGGLRIGAGRKRKSLEERLLEGEIIPTEILGTQKDFEIPKPKSYLTADSKSGKVYAGRIYLETYDYLKKCGCAEIIPPQLVSNFAQAVSQHIQAEEIIKQTGLLSRHPTTGEPMANPLVKISLDYLKMAQQIWYMIFQTVKENSISTGGGSATDTMELILRQTRQVK